MATNGATQILYFSHGGGPLPILGDASHGAMIKFMTWLPSQLRRPDAIVVVSAHWEESAATVLGSAHPPMFYDYYGFPPQAYDIQYPAPGDPELAKRIVNCLADGGVPSRTDTARGFDHGLFIPLKMMYPNADVPAIQLSLLQGLNPAAHIVLGRALRKLDAGNLLVIGSGFSFHNMRAFFGEQQRPDPANDAFQDWLIHVVAGSLSQKDREQRLVDWQSAPSARYCHPREEHLLPLHVCVGMAGRPGSLIFDDKILNKRSVAFLWQ
jgi:aromatic ring-opening dioxygenase catalytic subunit (LigB family)